MPSIGTLYGTLKLNSEQYERGIRKATTVSDRFGRKLDSLSTGIMARFATIFSVGVIANQVRGLVEYGSALTDAAEQVRIGVEQLQVLQNAARDAGVKLEILERALRNVTLRTEEAAGGNLSYQKAFAQLNIDIAEFARLPTERKLETIGQAYVRAGKSAEAFNAVSRILGEEAGPKLTEVLTRLGEDGLSRLSDETEAAGQVLSDFNAKVLDQMADKAASLTNKLKVLGGSLLAITGSTLSGEGPLFSNINVFGGELAKGMLGELAQTENIGKIKEIPKELADLLEKAKSPLQKSGDLALEIGQMLDEYGELLTTEQQERLNNYWRKFHAEALRAEEDTNGLAEAAKDLGLTFSSAFEDAIVEGENLRDVVQGLGKDILRIFVRKTVTEPLGGLLSGLFTSGLSGIFGGARASGGPVDPSRFYMVGERGPELFVPNRSGFILPNTMSGRSDAIVINQTINLSAGVAGQVRAEVLSMLPAIKKVAVAGVEEARIRKGRG